MIYMASFSFLRRARFGLGKLFALMLVVALGLGWIASAHRQRADVALMRAANPGTVLQYEHELDAAGKVAVRARSGSDGRLGLDYVSSIAGAELFYPTDADIQRVAAFRKLRRLVLERSIDLTDAGMVQIAQMKQLRLLVLDEADQVTDAGLLQLASLKNLQELQLGLGRSMTPAGIAALQAKLPGCRIRVRENREDLASAY